MKKELIKHILATLAVIALVAAVVYFSRSSSSSSEDKLKKALKLYSQGESSKAAKILEMEPGQYVPLKDGCELMISAFAETNQTKLLETAAVRCLNEGKAAGIAHEGYAKSLTDQGRVKEAITMLAKEASNKQHHRLFGALAYLYILDNQKEKAGEFYLKAIAIGDPWTPWVTRSLKHNSLKQDEAYMTRLIAMVTQKEKPVAHIERSLIAPAEQLGLKEQVELLKSRQSTPNQ